MNECVDACTTLRGSAGDEDEWNNLFRYHRNHGFATHEGLFGVLFRLRCVRRIENRRKERCKAVCEMRAEKYKGTKTKSCGSDGTQSWTRRMYGRLCIIYVDLLKLGCYRYDISDVFVLTCEDKDTSRH